MAIIGPPHGWRGKAVNHLGVGAALYAARLGDGHRIYLERETPVSAFIADIKNFIRVDDDIGTAGQPTAQQFRAVRDAGYEAVVNLLPSEQDNALKGEDALIRDLGMEYHYIPVVWTAPQPQDFTAFCDVMHKLEGKKIFVHCAMNMRVTAFYSSYAMRNLGWSRDQADALVARVWEVSPNFKMDDTWRAFVTLIRQ